MSNCIKCNTVLPENSIFCPYCGKKQVVQPKRSARRGNGTGSVYKRGKYYTASVVLGYKLQDGKAVPIRITKSGFFTKKDAIAYIPVLRNERPKKAPTIFELWERFKDSRQFERLSPSRQEKYHIAWHKIEKETLTPIDLYTVSDLQRIVDSHAKSYYPARDVRDLLSKLYQLALPDQYVTINLAEYIELPPLNTKDREAFTPEDIILLWDDYIAGNTFTGYILLMIYSGMMPGELLCARKDQIDWDIRCIVGAGKKTKERKQTPIVLADMIIPVLADLCEHTEGDKIIQIGRDAFYDRYYETLQRVGCRRLTPYSARHTTASALAAANVNPNVIKKVMRHSRFSTTEHYIHMDMSSALEAVNQLKQPE